MPRIPNMLILFLVVVLLTAGEYLYMLLGGADSLVGAAGIYYGDPNQSLLEQRVNQTIEAFIKEMKDKAIQKEDLVLVLEKLKVIEENMQPPTPAENEGKSQNIDTSSSLQQQLASFEERIEAHEQESSKNDELTNIQEKLSSVERLVQAGSGLSNLTNLGEKLSLLDQSIKSHEETPSAEKTDLERLKEYISSVEQKVQSITDAHITFLGRPYSGEPFYGLNNQTFCVPWDVNMDIWWTHHVDWSVSLENETHQCFSQMEDPEKADFFRKLYDIQFNGNCSNVYTKLMWSSGWGADLRNVVDGLQQAVKLNQPMEVHTQGHWHYAHANDRSACPTEDYRCYFLDLSSCEPSQSSYNGNLLNPKIRLDRNPGTWYYEYATRQQTWLRQKVLKFSSKVNITSPCTVAHVRRADIVLHKNRIRRYHEIDDYVERMDKDTKNIFLLTDDENAIGEALTKFPQYNWIFIDRPRHKGAEGGFENQVPSNNPKFEVIVLLSIFRLVKKCSTLIHTKSGFAILLRREMEKEGFKRVNIDLGAPVFNDEYALTLNISKVYPLK